MYMVGHSESSERSLRLLRTNISNMATCRGINGSIYTPLHHLLGGIANFKQRGGIGGGLLVNVDNIDGALTVVYKHSEMTPVIVLYCFLGTHLPLMNRAGSLYW